MTQPGRGFAMVESSGVTAIYRDGDRLPGGEIIAGIDADSVTLTSAGAPSRLAFKKSDLQRTVSAGMPVVARRRPGGAVDSPAVYEVPTEARKEQRVPILHATLTQHVMSTDALSAVRFKRVRTGNGKMGLRVQWLRKDDLTDMLGLRPGDVILAVNGRSMDDPKTMGTLLRTLPTAREVVIDLERGNASHRLVVPLL